MRLDPLYTIRFFYPDGWQINLTGKKGTEEDHFYFAEGKCEGRISGRFRGSNHPHRRTDETAAMNLQGFIKTDDSALINARLSRLRPFNRQVPGVVQTDPSIKPRHEVPSTSGGFRKTHYRQREVQMAERCGVRHFGGG